MRLIIPILLNCLLVISVYLIDKCSHWSDQHNPFFWSVYRYYPERISCLYCKSIQRTFVFNIDYCVDAV